MNATTHCPDRSILEQLIQGQIADDDVSAIEQHMLNCDECARIADQLVSSSDITAMVAQVETGAFRNPEAETVERLIQLTRSLKSKSHSSGIAPAENEQTVVGASCVQITEETVMPDQTVAGRDLSLTSFLRAAEQSDEIGRLGGYRILQVLGSGGMGIVYRAEDPRLRRQVALKVMKPTVAANPEAKARFLKEAEATAAIEHDNIVTIYQVGEDNGIPFIAMQFLKGESLQARLDRVGKLRETETLRIGIEVANGLQAAHSRGLIHRDIKPDNIWLQEGNDRVRIVDFGLVRNNAEDAGLTQSGVVLGTPKYMAPEQARGHEVDHRCDLFSLGSVMYRMVSGRAPFEGSNLTATLIAVAHEDAKPLSEVAPGVSPRLAELMTRLLAKNRDQRPDSAAAVAQHLQEIEAGPSALPITSAGGSQKPPKRRTTTAMFAGFAAMLLLAVLVIKLRTKDGTVVIELDSAVPVAEVEVDGTSVRFTPDANGRHLTVHVPEGTHELALKTADGLSLSTDLGEKPVTVAVNATTKIRAWLADPIRSQPDSAGTGPSVEHAASLAHSNSASVLANGALRFDGVDDYVHIPTLAFQEAPLTLEAWITPDAVRKVESSVLLGWKMNAMLAMDMDEGAEALSLYGQVWLPNYSDMSHNPNEAAARKYTPTQHWRSPFAGGHLHHVAIVISSVDFVVYLDGTPSERKAHEGLRTLPNNWAGLHHLSLGAGVTPHKQNPTIDRFFPGLIHAVRISNTARYAGKFVPGKLIADDATLALYDFQQNSGEVLKDVSGHGHDGRIVGATWTRSASKSGGTNGATVWTDSLTSHSQPTEHAESMAVRKPDPPSAAQAAVAGTPAAAVRKSPNLWPAGPFPAWASEEPRWSIMKESFTIPGVVERPTTFKEIGRWNVDTVQSRGAINVARFSPDGKWLATGSSDGHVRVYDVETKKLHQLLPGIGGSIGAVDLAWHPDSQKIAVAADNEKKLRIWTIDGQLLREELAGGETYNTINSVAWTFDGSRLICGGANRLEVRDTDGTLIKALVSGQDGPHSDLGSIAASPDRQRFIVWQNDGARIWNAESFELEATIPVPCSNGTGGHRVRWSSKDRISLSTFEQLTICNADGTVLKEFTTEPLCATAWHPDGENLTIWRWDPYNLNTTSGELTPADQRIIIGAGVGTVPTAMEWSPDGKRIVLAGGRLVVCRDGITQIEYDAGTTMMPVSSLSLKPDGSQIASVCHISDDCVRLWSSDGAAQGSMPLNEPLLAAPRVAWSPDGQHVAVAWPQSSHFRIGKPGEDFVAIAGNCVTLAWNSNGTQLAAGLTNGHILITDTAGSVLQDLDTGEMGGVNVGWSKQGTLVAHAGQKILRVDLASSEPKVALLTEVPSGPADSPAVWRPDGREVFVGFDIHVNVADGVTERIRRVSPLVAWAPDGSKCLFPMGPFTALLRPDGSQLFPRTTNASTTMLNGAWSPSGDRVYVGYDQSLLVARNAEDLHLQWAAVILPQQKSVTFGVGGSVIDGDRETLESEFAYYAADDKGNVRMLSPTEFEMLTGEEILPVPGRFFDSDYRFAMTLGDDWKSASSDASTVPGITRAAFSRPGGVSLNLFIQETGAYVDPSWLVNESAKAQEEKLSATVLEKEVRKIAGRDAMWMIVEGAGTGTAITGNGPVKTTQHWIAIPREEDVLVALMTSPTGTFESNQKLFLKTMETLTLKK